MVRESTSPEQPQDKEYEVGYGCPPKSGQFKPGKSGNPKGRKRKPKSVQSQMQTVLAKKVSINEGGRARSVPLQEVILRNLANTAAKGDLKATAFVFNLISSPEYADTDTIEAQSLSPDDQQMLSEMISQMSGTGGSSSDSKTASEEHRDVGARSVEINETTTADTDDASLGETTPGGNDNV